MGINFKNILEYSKTIFFYLFIILIWLFGFVFIIIIFKGKVYIEILIIFILVLMFISCKLWKGHSTRVLAKNYKPENDKARKGGTVSGGVKETESTDGHSVADTIRFKQLERREFLQKTNVSDVGKNSSGTRKFLNRRRN